jgi:hypothetical protein
VLIFGGRILTNSEKLTDAGLTEDKMTLHMMVRLRSEHRGKNLTASSTQAGPQKACCAVM